MRIWLIFIILLITACTSEETQIKQEIKAAGYCSTDADCVSAGSKCPFDCAIPVNVAEKERIAALVDSYESNCQYSCVETVLSCEAGACVARAKPADPADDIRAAIDLANYCLQDEDCVHVSVQCPFGCDVYVNRAHASMISDLSAAYVSDCAQKCALPPAPACVEQRCVAKE